MLLIICFLAKGQDTVVIRNGIRSLDVFAYTKFFKSSSIKQADSAYHFFLNHPEKISRQKDPFIGIVKEPYWFLISLKNNSTVSDFVLEIKQSHLRHIVLYEAKAGELTYKSTVGELYPFTHRPMQHRNYSFPLTISQNERCDLLLYLDHENSLALPTVLWTEAAFHENDYTFNLVAGVVIGFLLFCAFISLASYFIVSNAIFIWYALYLLFSTLYLFTDLGFSFQYLFPQLTRFDGPFSIYTPLFMFMGLVKFVQELLSLRQYHPKIYWSLTFIILLFLFLILVDLVFQESWRKYSYYFLPLVFCIVLAGLCTLLIAGFVSLRTRKKMAIYFFVSYVPMLSILLFAILGNAFGLAIYTFLNPTYLGVLFEVSVLSVALITQYRDVQLERDNLQSKVVEQQKEYYQTYIDGIEKERNRIAGDLHDDVGSKLSHLKRAAFNSENENSKLLDEVIQDLRNISHDLAPTIAQVSGLIPLLEKLISQHQKETNMKINLRVFDFRECLSPDQIIQLYRILQEAVNNVIKHSEATKIDIQVFGYKKEMSVSIEDNGKGFDIAKPSSGLGLNQLKIRAEILKGKIEINSHPDKGSLILVQVPLE